MKLQEGDIEIEKSPEIKSNVFKIDTANIGIILKTLISLYSDPIGSICREITSNCFDAHRERNIKLKEGGEGLEWLSDRENIEIEYAPKNELTGQDDVIIFRDFGIGISQDRIDNVYRNYFSSTKRADNEQIGGFGLGSKTPFSYRNDFYVITKYNGRRYVYLVHLSESKGGTELMYEEATTELNGTEVIVPLKYSSDLYKFTIGLSKQLIYFDNIDYINLNIDNEYTVYQTQHFMYRTDTVDHFNNSLHIVLGKVAYRLDFGVLGFEEPIYCPIAMKFEVGELSVSVSREDLMYDDETKAKILDRIKIVSNEIVDLLTKKYADITDFNDFLRTRWDLSYSENLYLDDTTVVPGIASLIDKEVLKQFVTGFKLLPGFKLPIDIKKVFLEYEVEVITHNKDNQYVVAPLAEVKLLTDSNFKKYRVADKLNKTLNAYLAKRDGAFLAIKKRKDVTDGDIAKMLGLIVVTKDGSLFGDDGTINLLPPDIQHSVNVYKKFIFDHMMSITESYLAIADTEEFLNRKEEIEEEVKSKEDRHYWRKIHEMIFVKELPITFKYSSINLSQLAFVQNEIPLSQIITYTGTLIYGYQEDDKALKAIYSIFANHENYQDSKKSFIINPLAIRVMKISRQNKKYFFNAIHVNDFMKSKHKQINRFVTHQMIEDANLPPLSKFMDNINSQVARKVELITKYERGFSRTRISVNSNDTFIKELVDFAKVHGNYSTTVESYLKDIKDYFEGVPLLEFVDLDNMRVNSYGNTQAVKDHCEAAIKDYLKLKHKRINSI